MKIYKYIKENFPLTVSSAFRNESLLNEYIANTWDKYKSPFCCDSTYRRVIKINRESRPDYAKLKIQSGIESILIDIATGEIYKSHPSSLYSLFFYYDYEITYYTHSEPEYIFIEIVINPEYKRIFCDEWHKFGKECNCDTYHTTGIGGDWK